MWVAPGQAYASMLVLSHFKGHPMGGFGGALKQLSIGCASPEQVNIHSGGASLLGANSGTSTPNRIRFHRRRWPGCVQRPWSITSATTSRSREHRLQPFGRLRLLRSNGRSLYEDIGIFASLDPVAIDAACPPDAVLVPMIPAATLTRAHHLAPWRKDHR